MATADKMLDVAASYIGVKGDHNIFNYWYWVTYTRAYTYDPGTPWCAAFMSYVAMKAGLKCKYSASAAAFATQFERIPVEKEHLVRKGDFVIFNWDGRTSTDWADHIGIVEWSTIAKDGKFGTIEGNTGNGVEGQVLRMNRDNWSTYFTAFYRPKYDAASGTTARLFGIDVSSNQPERIVRNTVNDFAIVKMGGNPQDYTWNYVNPYAKQQAKDAMDKHGLLGFYWFTNGIQATTEADFFVEQVKKLGYLGKAMLVIDYEADAVSKGATWVKKFADRVKEKAGYAPVIYASGSVIVGQNLFSLGYPIWCANYYNGYEPVYGYDTSGMKIYGGCENSAMWQFTSSGYLSGYDGPLDLNVFFGGKDAFRKLMGPQASQPTKPTASVAKLSVDGQWGILTTKELQRQLGTTVNGKKDKATYRALQKRLKVTVDGIFGPVTKKALQRKLGVTADGYVGPVTVKALQRALNAGKVAKW